MPAIEPSEPGGSGVPGWTVLVVVVGIVALLGISAWFVVRSLTDTEAASTSATLNPASSTVAPTTSPPPSTITGEFVIEESFDSATALLFVPGVELVEGTPCSGINNDDGVESGARVAVTDVNGTLIGTEALSGGSLALKPNIEDRTVPKVTSSEQRKRFVYANADCVFAFSIPLSNAADFYTIVVGSRDGMTYSHSEMARAGWFIHLNR